MHISITEESFTSFLEKRKIRIYFFKMKTRFERAF